ncbi:MAG: hypothetical protein OEW62_01875 [Candidatus Bathyarchaeota archaeon]|nr:hypothetical protein [Candidatus Bathyarchaeota archaeon]
MRLKQLCFSLLIITLLFVNTMQICASDNADLAKWAIGRARSSLVDAYKSVLDAEKAGADVTSLTKRLTNAGSNLTNSYLLYEVESYDVAVALADNCYEVGEKVKAEAEVLKATASTIAMVLFWFQIFCYIGALVIIVFASVLGWQVFEKRYYRKILGMKPEAS